MRPALFLLGAAWLTVGCTRAATEPGPANVTANAAVATPAAGRPAPADPRLDHELVGQTMPAWTTEEWTNSPPLTLEGLRGRVVLVRWFAGTSCPMCSATAPSLRELHREYAAQGLTVVGMYHHKEDAPLKPGEYAAYVKSYGFEFPVARDPEWTTLKAWWLKGHTRDFTSVSFLLDREGRVRGVHKGGRFAPGDEDYAAVKRGVEALLSER